ncbi:chromosome segregation ATPase [Methanosarcina sp. KYL-1]|uniref:chromosome segregation ATPase n=1 Tax=Methanosarcina sp. KYL-1 TaxID=2602068 RepID=UPI002100C4D4|nr:chromosome segregation ATPase [Methanosarcina sp. KYL-1]MCQ1536580.1 chromosome segregation ATPase [Methanosarcina sp. KYL-1]
MKYIYQDSTELPIQRDFIEDLKVFIEITARVIPLENSIIELKCKNKEAILALNNKIKSLNVFEEKFNYMVKKLADEVNTEEVRPCVDAVLSKCSENIGQKRELLESESKKIGSGAAQEYQRIEEKILDILTLFLISGVYGAEKNFELSANGNGISGEMEGSVSGLQYVYKLVFAEESLTVEKLIGSLSLPGRTRTGLIRKEEKIKMLDISDFLVSSVEYDSQKNIRITLENKKANRKFRIEGGELKYFVYEDDKEITADKELGSLVDMGSLAKIPEKVQAYLKTNIRSYFLSKILLDEEDAVSNNQIFDCLKVIAEQYGAIVQECLTKGHNKEEITIKMEEADGTRTEKYITKAEIYTQLAEVGGEGVEIAGILGVDSKAQIKESKYLIV